MEAERPAAGCLLAGPATIGETGQLKIRCIAELESADDAMPPAPQDWRIALSTLPLHGEACR